MYIMSTRETELMYTEGKKKFADSVVTGKVFSRNASTFRQSAPLSPDASTRENSFSLVGPQLPRRVRAPNAAFTEVTGQGTLNARINSDTGLHADLLLSRK